MRLEPIEEWLYKTGFNYKTHLYHILALVQEELLDGPRALEIAFEFLGLNYLESPNCHDLIFAMAVCSKVKGLSLEKFIQRGILYLLLTSILKREEIWFFEECHKGYFETFLEWEWEYDQLHPHLQFSQLIYKLVNDMTKFYQFNNH